ncbi:MAG: VCBS repeat-containing protein [Candidatus Kapaibacterium sp.]
MKTLLSLIATVLFCSMSLSAQIPVQDTIPQLKEWWRTDVLKYGKYGMTWLDNFYQGKGALVVYTSEGVKTWLLRFPGDTMNVFTWEKGSANIKTGDFNGDGITDYVDENSNIYEGIKNGEPPKMKAISLKISIDVSNYPDITYDVNLDGYADLVIFSPDNSWKSPGEMRIAYGSKTIDAMQWQRVTIQDIDSNNVPVSSYVVHQNGEMRIICIQSYWTNMVNYPFKKVYKEGLRLVRVWWEGNGFKSEVLDQFTVDTKNGTGLYVAGALLRQPQGKNYFVHATQILGKSENSDVAVYDLNGNTLHKLYSTRIDSISTLTTLGHSIGGDSLSDWYIRVYGTPYIRMYDGNIREKLSSLGQVATGQILSLITIGDVTGDAKPDIAVSTRYYVAGTERTVFTILNRKDSISSVVEENNMPLSLSITTISPMPVSKDKKVQIKVRVPQAGSYTVYFYDSTGKKIVGKSENYQLSGEQIIHLTIGDYGISSGMYRVQVEGNGRTAHCSIIIQ